MNARSKNVWTMLLVTSILFVGLSMLNGCKKSEPTPPPVTPAAMTQEHAATSAEPAAKVASAAEQTICPVMGGAINKDIFVEYKGKKVYFCCPECKGKFEAEPEKYIAKLPQFAK